MTVTSLQLALTALSCFEVWYRERIASLAVRLTPLSKDASRRVPLLQIVSFLGATSATTLKGGFNEAAKAVLVFENGGLSVTTVKF